MKDKMDSLASEIQEFLWRENPVEATLVGIHRYDDRLERLDVVSRKNKLKRKSEYAEQINRLEKQAGSDGLTDELSLIRDSLEVGIVLEDTLQSLDRDAGIYPRLALYGIYQLIARSGEPYHYRALRSIDRMREIPRLLAEGKLNLTYGQDIPRLWTQAAIEMTVAGREYLAHLTGLLTAEVPELGEVLEKYAKEALNSFDEYLEFLVNEIEPRSRGDFAVGEELFNFLLEREHKLGINAAALEKNARREVKTAQGRLQRLASRMEGPDDWRLQLDRIAAESSQQVDSLQDFWSGHIGRMRMAVEQAALLSLPAEKELTVMETPKFERGAIPQAGYIPAPPLEKKSRAFFCFTPGLGQDEETGPANNAEGYSEYQAMLTVIRELYPGRHTLLTACRPVGAGALYLPPQLVLENGWCKYVCELLLENRLIREPDLKMLIYHEHLVDAHRVLADIRLHCGGIDEDRAIADLVESTGMSEQAARFEVRKLAGSPTASVGAMLGRIQIRKLRNEYKKKTGEEFSLRRFHDRFLELCWLPLAVLRRRLIE